MFGEECNPNHPVYQKALKIISENMEYKMYLRKAVSLSAYRKPHIALPTSKQDLQFSQICNCSSEVSFCGGNHSFGGSNQWQHIPPELHHLPNLLFPQALIQNILEFPKLVLVTLAKYRERNLRDMELAISSNSIPVST